MLMCRGVRGAITIEENTKDAIELATIELLEEMVKRNQVDSLLKNPLNAGNSLVFFHCGNPLRFQRLDLEFHMPLSVHSVVRQVRLTIAPVAPVVV